MSFVFVLDTNKQPRNPIHPGEARRLLSSGQAAVFRRFPFTIILKTVVEQEPAPLRLKLDPGSKTTGIALVDDATGRVVWAAELTHRGQQVRDALESRRATRRSRRQRHTRYRAPRFLNRTRPKGWLAPSLESRIKNVETWVARLRRLAPVAALSMELVRFDMQLMQDAETSGVAYQQGELVGYEIRQYLLEKWHRTCAYCGETGIPLEIEHLTPRSRGGSDRVSNLTLACHECNQRKGNKTAAEFGHPELQAKAKQPMGDAAAVNSTRWRLFERLKATGLPVEVGSGGLTQFNRTGRTLDKTHWLDAACVGKSTPLMLHTFDIRPLSIKATGHGNRQMAGLNAYGFPTRHRSRVKVHFGFQTGDIVKAVVPTGKRAGVHIGRVLCRATGSFDITTTQGRQAGISYRFCTAIHRSDGYSYGYAA
jgi:5-methylcytosine-specific restriction endonuclease McrA